MAIDTLGANALASNSVTTAKIANDAVTGAKIPADAVVAADIADDSITGAKLANDIAISTTGNIATTSSGTLSVAGTATVTGAITASSGVAIGGTGSANTLDDYEEGTWTPTVGGNATYHGRAGKYTKVGRTVHASGFMQVNALGTGSNNTMSGFPFASSHAGGGNQNGSIGLYLYLAVNVLSLEMYYSNASTVTAFKGQTTAGGNSSGNLAIFGNNARIDFNITYETA